MEFNEAVRPPHEVDEVMEHRREAIIEAHDTRTKRLQEITAYVDELFNDTSRAEKED